MASLKTSRKKKKRATGVQRPVPLQTKAEQIHQVIQLFSIGQYQKTVENAQKLIQDFPQDAFGWKALGTVLAQTGHYQEALPHLKKALELSPADPETHTSLGKVYVELDQAFLALQHCQRALAAKPAHAEALYISSQALHKLEKLDDALACARKALDIRPDFAAACFEAGLVLKTLGRSEDALAYLTEAIRLNPDSAEAHNNLGNLLQEAGQWETAREHYRRALTINPNFALAHNNLGTVLLEAGYYEEALAAFETALKHLSDSPEIHYNMGVALKHLGRLENAAASYMQTLALNPVHVGAHNNLGVILREFGQAQQALAHYRRALEINPEHAEAHNNLGILFREMGRLTDALAHSQRASTLRSDLAEAHVNLGNVLHDLGRLGEARQHHRTALQIRPDDMTAFSALLFNLNYDSELSAEDIYRAYQEFDQRFGLPHHAFWKPHTNDRDLTRRLKVGYVSPDFHKHSTRHFLEPLLAAHCRRCFELTAYAEQRKSDEWTARYRRYVDHWVVTSGISDANLAERIRADQIDILVDLAGHSDKNRLGVFARKPAPVSVSWMGYGYTTGLSAIDYYLTNAICTPEGSERLFAEKPWRLNRALFCYRPAEAMGVVSPLPALTQGRITLGTLSRGARINHHCVRVWSVILNQLSRAVLVINSKDFQDSHAARALQQQFVARGIDPQRLSIGFTSPPWDVYRSLDIALDCFPHNPGTTLVESLYMGVPYITLSGRPSVGRIGAMILEGFGRREWVACSENEYIQKVVELATDIETLADIRARLRNQMQTSPLMDETGFARAVENAYRSMWRKWLKTQAD